MGRILRLGVWVFFAASAFSAFGQSAEESAARSAEQAGKLREAFTQYVAALQKTAEGSGDERRLQEAIVRLAPRLSPTPAIPEEARRFGVRGRAWMQDAKNEADVTEAIKEFAKALRIAPWWADGYINNGVALEKAGRYSDAVQSLKMYLLASPSAPDAGKVKDQVYMLEVRQEKAAQEKAAKDAVAQQQREKQIQAQRWLDGINGARFVFQAGPWGSSSMRFIHTFDVRSTEIVIGQIAYYGSDVQFNYPSGTWVEIERAKLQGREFVNRQGDRGTISEDGNTVHVVQTRGGPIITYRRQP